MGTRRRRALAAIVALAAVAVVAGTSFAAGSRTGNGSAAASAPARGFFSSSNGVRVQAAAVINADGTKVRASKLPFALSSVSRLSPGVYDIRFDHNISGCAWFGSLGFGSFGGSTGPGTITISGRAGTNNGLFVTTFNAADAPTDYPWMVEVVC